MMQISELLKQHRLSDIKATDANGNTVLHLVVENEKSTVTKKIQILDILLDKGLEISTPNRNGDTVLHLAIKNRMKDVTDFLLKKRKVELNNLIAIYMVKNEYEEREKLKLQLKSNRLVQKEESESADFLEWIILKGLDIDGKDSAGNSAFLLAVDYNLQHILPTLLKYTKDIDYVEPKTERTLLQIILEINALLQQSHFETKSQNKNYYRNYMQRYAMSIVQTLLNRGVTSDTVGVNGNIALHTAVALEKNISIIEILINHSTNVNHRNNEGRTPFFLVIYRWLKSKEPDPAFFTKISRALIDKGANINERDQYGTSPLRHAIEMHNLQAVELLRDNGADFSVITQNGQTLLHMLANKANYYTKSVEEVVIILLDMLISKGCQVRAEDESGNTPLHLAANNNDEKMVRMLIEHGADVNCKNRQKETPLYCLATNYRNKDTRAAELLVKHGANVDAKDIDGFTVLQSPDTNVRMLEFLLRHGANLDALVDGKHLDLWMQDYKSDEDEDDEYEILLKRHWIKLNVVKLKRSARLEHFIKKEKCEKYHDKCLKECETLKNTFIYSHTSLYNFLHTDLNNRRAYLYSEKLQELVQSSKLDEQFPELSILIFSSYHEAVTRKELMKPAKMAWLELTKICLLEECIELIFSFLSNSDLFDMIEKNEINS